MPGPEDIEKAIRRLTSKRLLIGIPQENDAREGGVLGNVSRAYVHELGSPARNIPARPFLVPGVEKVLPTLTKELEEAGKAALAGDFGAVDNAFRSAGIKAVESVKQTIMAGIPPPIKPESLLNRVTGRGRRARELQRRNRAARKAGQPGISMMDLAREQIAAGDVTPLVDVGKMRDAITYVVREVKG